MIFRSNYSNLNIKEHLENLTELEVGGILYFVKYLDETLPYTFLNLIGFTLGSLGT